MQSKSYPQTKGRTLGGTIHRRSRSGNRKVHHQKCPRKNAGGSKRKAEKGNRGKRRHRLWAGENLHGWELAGSLVGKLRQGEIATVYVQDLPRFSEKPHQAADRQRSAGRVDFSGFGTK